MGQWSHKTSKINAQDEGNFDAYLGSRNKNICFVFCMAFAKFYY